MDKDKEEKKDIEEDVVYDDNIGEDGEEGNQSGVIKKLRERIKKLENENREYLTGWQKERAEGVNLRKRLEEEKRDFAKFAKEDIATEIIPVLDSFESAFKNKEAWEKVDKNWRVGVEYIHNQLVNVLGNHGVTIINPLGEKFNPERDEAVESVLVEREEDDQKIIEVVSVGYKLQDRIIRAPKVKVGEYRIEN